MELKGNRATEERKSQQSLRKDHRRGEEGVRGGRRERESGRESEAECERERQTQRREGMREKVCSREADRKREKSDMAESFCCFALQMEVNVKQSLLLVSGGINSLEWDSAVRKVNACLSVQIFLCSNMLYFPKCSCCILTLHPLSPSQCWTPLGSFRKQQYA